MRIQEELQGLSSRLYDKALKLLKDNMHQVTTVEEAKDKPGIVMLPWCGEDSCAQEIESIIDKSTLGEPIEDKPSIEGLSCPLCGKPAISWMRYAKTY